MKVTKEARKKIADRVAVGESQSQVAADHGVCQKTISSIAARERKKQETEKKREEAAAGAASLSTGDSYDESIVHGDFREVCDRLPDASAELIFTDPPYDTNSVGLYADLAKLGDRILMEGGSLITYAGHRLVPKVLDAVLHNTESLNFYWLCAAVHTGKLARMPRTGQVVGFKPLLWFVKEKDRFDTSVMIEDTVISKEEKDHHKWQQGEVDARHFIEKLTRPVVYTQVV